MGKFKKFTDLVNVSQITSSVQNSFNEQIDKMVSQAESGNLNEESIQSMIEPYEKKFEEIEKVRNAVSVGQTVIEAFKDPIGTAKDIGVDALKEALENSQTVQNLKKEAMEKISEKLNEIPQVQEAKAQFEKITSGANDITVPNEPSTDPNLPSASSLVAAAVRESRLARMLIKTE